MKTTFINFVLFVLFSYTLSSQSEAPAVNDSSSSRERLFTGGGILFDEDFFLDWFVKDVNKDRDYTGGLALTFSGRFVEQWKINSIQKGVDWLFTLKKIHDQRAQRSFHNFKFSVTVFSPQGKDLNKTYPIIGDRPYACITYFSTSTTSIDELNKKALTTEFSAGVFGSNLGRDSQAFIHEKTRECDTCRPYDPVGWKNQISNGGELALQYNISFKNLLLDDGFRRGRDVSRFKWYDVFISRDIYLGPYTALSAGLTGRIGMIRSNWALFSSSPIGASTEAAGKLPQKKHSGELYLFSTLRPKFIGYNAAMQGLTKTPEYALTWDQVNHFGFQFEAGIGITVPGWATVNFVYAHRTPEFKGNKGLSHDWLAIYLYFHRRFYK